MVPILEGNSGHAGKCVFLVLKSPICDCSQSNQMHYRGEITEIVPYVRAE